MEKKHALSKKQWLTFAVILLPVLQAGVIAFFYWLKYKTGLPMPQWNDEGAYYELIKTWLATGQPLGYWGFDGGHAILGTGSAWSPAILLPYGLFGMLFGWNYSSAFFANLLFWTLAQLLFVLLVSPEERSLWRLLLLQSLSVLPILYSVTLMSELLRFSLAVILAGMLYRLYFKECGKLFQYVILPLYLLALIQVYIFFVFALPLYVFGAARKLKWWKKALLSLGALGIAGGGSYYLLHLISSNYNIYKTEKLLHALQNFDIAGVLGSLLGMVKEGILGLISCFRSTTGHGMFRWFVPFLFVLIVVPAGKLIADAWKLRKKTKVSDSGNTLQDGRDTFWNHDRLLCAQVSFGTALFLGAFITVYSLEAFTFFRSLGIVVLFSLYLLLMTEQKWLFAVVLGCYAVGMVFLPANLADFTAERYPDKATVQEWDSLAEELEAVISIEEGAQPWQNTIAVFTLEPKVLASMPAGSGVNMMLYSDEIPVKAEYLFFVKEKETLRSDWLEHDYRALYEENRELLTTKYRVCWENEDYILYQRDK